MALAVKHHAGLPCPCLCAFVTKSSPLEAGLMELQTRPHRIAVASSSAVSPGYSHTHILRFPRFSDQSEYSFLFYFILLCLKL